MNETLDYLRTFATFPFAVRRFMAQGPLKPAEARRIVLARMERRGENFLNVVERSIYGWPRSPYLALLRHAGCTLGDVRALVQGKGVEGALAELRAAGVYITFEEFKGRRPIERPGFSLPVHASDFDNPFARRELNFRTGGSTGAAVAVAADLDSITAHGANELIAFQAHGLVGVPTALWKGPLPDSGLRSILRTARAGGGHWRWFSPVGERKSKHWLKYAIATNYSIFWLRLAGLPVPTPETVRVDEAIIVARWAAEMLKAHGRCLIRAGVSRGVRAAAAAEAAGLDMRGLTWMGGGEPVTSAKVSRIRQAGIHYIPLYGMVEANGMGWGCARPADDSDVHLFKSDYALLTHPFAVEGFDVSVPAFNLTALLPSMSKVMLNVQMDDYGIVEERSCGCELESYGFTTHLRDIRSYSKLTGEGATLIGNEAVRALEELLPARFGGTLFDYQLMEQEDEQGLTRLYLVVDPSIHLDDEQAAIDCVLEALSQSSSMADAARAIWQNAGTVRIQRSRPVWTGRGKFVSFFREKHSTAVAPRKGDAP